MGWIRVGAAVGVIGLLGLACGCAPTPVARTYDVYVSNHLQQPITCFVTKNGPPLENGWLSPEQLAAGPIRQDAFINSGQVVGPGHTAGAQHLVGHFNPGTSAVLRVYRQTGHLEDFAALSAGNPRRVDLYLDPGANAFVVTQDEKGLDVQRATPRGNETIDVRSGTSPG